MRRLSLLSVLIATHACRTPEPIEPAPSMPAPALAPAPEPRSVMLPAIPERCGGTVLGWLSADDGQLMFRLNTSPLTGEMVKSFGPPYWNPRTILLPRGIDEWFSPLLPGREGSAVAVRTTHGELHVEGRDELVELDPHTLIPQVLWAPGHRLKLLGRTGTRVMLLDYDGVVARVVGFDLDTGGILESEPIDVDLDELHLRPDMLYRAWRLDRNDAVNEWSGCQGPGDYVLPCRDDRLCRARLEDSAIRIEFVDLEPCSELAEDDPGVPVDGRLIPGVRVEIDSCQVRTNIYFPTLAEPAEQPCRVEVVEPREPESRPWFRELIVEPGCTLSTGFAEHAFALHPERVIIVPLPEREAWRVLLPYPDTAFDDGDCRQGELWLRALDWHRFSHTETWLGWEYGYCE